jgi:protoporphyrinogen oxidase
VILKPQLDQIKTDVARNAAVDWNHLDGFRRRQLQGWSLHRGWQFQELRLRVSRRLCEVTNVHAVIIGAGFSGLTAAYELAKHKVRVTVLEGETDLGGLAGSFVVNGTRLEKFYHHWFTSDRHIMDLIAELGATDQIVLRATRTGIYYANTVFRLSSPLDVLRFHPLRLVDRIRFGLLALRVRRVQDWRQLEERTAASWLRELGGDKVYEVVWEPLLRGKFGVYGDEVSAVWFWNKLKLRGGSRRSDGAEQLAYYRGGFASLADRLAAGVRAHGGEVRTGAVVEKIVGSGGQLAGVVVAGELLPADIVIATPALPIVADLLEGQATADYVSSLRRIKYLANVCVVLELDRSLSETYWLNVNDPSFPFVGVIEHTNFEPPETYGGRHLVYLSKYLPATDDLYQMTRDEVLEYTLPHLSRMFPAFRREWIYEAHVWRAQYSQPVVERYYRSLIPSYSTPVRGLFLASMAQVYPEDRGTNYAVREGKLVANLVREALSGAVSNC